MSRDPNLTERLRTLISQLQELSETRQLHWERQVGSAHRYARWKNNLLILGPTEALSESGVPRYLFITPFDSPTCVEVNSDDVELGAAVMKLVKTVEDLCKDEPATDPFAITDEILARLT